MNKRHHFIYLSIVLFCFSFTHQQGDYKEITDKAAIEASIQETLQSTTTLKSDFVQEKELSVMSETIVSEGSFYFKKENKIRWEYTTPYPYTIIINNNDVVIDDEGEISEYDINSNKVFQQVHEIMEACLKGTIVYDKRYDQSFYENESTVKAILHPKEKNIRDYITSIEIYLSKKDFTVEKIIISDAESDRTVIRFKNTTVNADIPDHTFTTD